MFTDLRHNTFISSNHETNEVYSACTSKHVSDKPFMSRDIYDPNREAIRITKVCKTKINRDASLFFFFEPVRVYACERLNQGALTMIYMACGPEDYMTHNKSSLLFLIPIDSALLRSS